MKDVIRPLTSASQPTGHSLTFRAITSGHGHFVAVGALGLTEVSTDGFHWSRWSPARWIDLYGVTANNDHIVAVGASGILQYKWDGSCRSVYEHPSRIFHAAAQGKGALVATGVVFSMGEDLVLVASDDGVAWRDLSARVKARHLEAIAHGGGTFLAAGSEIALSHNARAWELVRTPEGPGWGVLAVAWDGLRFICVGSRGEIAFSRDGRSWADRSSPVKTALRAVACGDGRYVAVGDQGVVLTSQDGEAWTRQVLTAADLYGVAYGQHRFVAVGENGTLICSEDGNANPG